MDVVYYDESIQKFITSLQTTAYAKTLKTIFLLERFGHHLMMPHCRHLECDLYELRIRGQQEVRLFYTFFNQRAVVVHGFIKKSQKTPQSEINKAKVRIQSLTEV